MKWTLDGKQASAWLGVERIADVLWEGKVTRVFHLKKKWSESSLYAHPEYLGPDW
jgi:hypothetical protein